MTAYLFNLIMRDRKAKERQALLASRQPLAEPLVHPVYKDEYSTKERPRLMVYVMPGNGQKLHPLKNHGSPALTMKNMILSSSACGRYELFLNTRSIGVFFTGISGHSLNAHYPFDLKLKKSDVLTVQISNLDVLPADFYVNWVR